MPKLISHRGNLSGKTINENHPSYILSAFDACDMVEIDCWIVHSRLYLGHDGPMYSCGFDFIHDNVSKLFVHAKNIVMLEYILDHKNIHGFWHENDQHTITSHGYIVAFPNNPLTKRSICMSPIGYPEVEVIGCYAVCCDNIQGWK